MTRQGFVSVHSVSVCSVNPLARFAYAKHRSVKTRSGFGGPACCWLPRRFLSSANMSYRQFQAEYASSSHTICFRTSSEPRTEGDGFPESPHTASNNLYGGFFCDQRSGKFNRSWDSWESFGSFLKQEQDALSIELLKVQTLSGKHRYIERRLYVCSRGPSGGRRLYDKKHPDRKRKVEKKFTDCMCRLVVKSYHGVSTILGAYYSDHNHAVGTENIKFTRISKETRNWIASMVRGRVDSNHIASSLVYLVLFQISR